MSNTQHGYIPAYPGDTVVVHFDHRTEGPREAEILETRRRYGCVNNGHTKQKPLLKGRFLDTGEEQYFDNGYVQAVVKRSGKPRPRINIYQNDPDVQFCVSVHRSFWRGTLMHLAKLAMSKLPFDIERPIDFDRLNELYDRDRAGLISESRMHGLRIYKVKHDLFQRWVRKNYTQICLTVKELDVRETASITEMEAHYWRSVEAEWDEDEKRREDEDWEEMFGGDPPNEYF